MLCQYEHGIDIKHTIPIQIFRDEVKKKIKQFQLDETSKTKQSLINSLLETITVLKKIFEEIIK